MTKRLPKSSKSVAVLPTDYAPLLAEIKTRIRTAQVKAALAANAELVLLYWQMGQRIAEMQAKEGWGAGVIPRLAADLHAEFPEMRGFSERNIGRMIRFFQEYPGLFAILPAPLAELSEVELVPQPAVLLSPAVEPSPPKLIVPTAYLFSAKGAAFINSLGQRPRNSCNANPPALKARFIPVLISFGLTVNRRVESRLQRLFMIRSESWGDAPGCYESARLALNRYPPAGPHNCPGITSTNLARLRSETI